jgi:MGT family glycosyltransferase
VNKMKIAAFNVPTTGHVDPTLPLVAELVGRGHQVSYYLTEKYRAQVEATGATYLETPGIPEDYFDEVSAQFNPLRLATQLLVTSHDLLPGLAGQLRELAPATVLYDSMCPWGRMVARLAGLPAIASMSLLELPPSYLRKSGQMGALLKLLPRILPWVRPYRSAVHRLEAEYPLKIPRFPTVINWPGDLNISYTSSQINPQAKELGARYLFVGPPMPETNSEDQFPFDALNPERRLIYVALGTVFSDNPAFFRLCMETFAESDCQVVMSLGNRLSPESLGNIPANFIVRSYVPQLEVLKRADLFINHGGVNSVHQALYYGVPLLFFPQQVEQALVAARIAELGAGYLVQKQSVSTLRAAANRLLNDDSYRRQAAALGASLKEAGGVQRAADAIASFAAGG